MNSLVLLLVCIAILICGYIFTADGFVNSGV